MSRPTEVFSHLLVALASSDEKKAFVSAALTRKGLNRVSVKYQKQIEALWEEANEEALSHLNIVLKNNPKKTKEEILRRPDIKSALTWPYEQAAKKSEKILREAWASGEAEAVQKAKGEFKLFKETWQGHEVDEVLLESVLSDLRKNAKGMFARYSEALRSGDSAKTESLARDARLRASYSVSTAVWGVATQVRDSAFAKIGLHKIWLARTDDWENVCSHCRNLHGTILKPGEQFDVGAGDKPLRAYLNTLLGPPRHPSCRCVLALVRLKKPKK